MAIVLMKNGITDMNTSKASDLEAVRKDLLALIEDVDVRISYSGAYSKLPKDQFWLMTAWSGDMVAGWNYAPPYTTRPPMNIGYWFPPDRKGPVDNDLIAIPRTPSILPSDTRSSTSSSSTSMRWTTSPGTATSHRRTRRT